MRSLPLVRLVTFIGLLLAPGYAAANAYVIAGIHWTGGKAQFFLSDGTYIRYDVAADKADAGYPKPIDDKTWPGLGPYAMQIAAACNAPNGKAYFFLTTGQYLRYDIKADRVDAGYPKPIDAKTWPGLEKFGKRIYSALNWSGDKIQFLLDDGRYLRYDIKADKADAGYPRPIDTATWPGLAPYAANVAGAINWANGKAYIFLDNGKYIRYDIAADKVDDGYPKNVNARTWPGMDAAFRKKRWRR